MREKLLQFMQSEGLKPGQLADMLGINPAGISHILSGRNKPGFDLLQKILRRFPRINPDWLLLDLGEMYRVPEDGHAVAASPAPILTGLFENVVEEAPKIPDSSGTPSLEERVSTPEKAVSKVLVASETELEQKPRGRKVVRVVILYDDNTCESYTPMDH